MTRFARFKPGEIDHIRVVSGGDKRDQVYECGRCGEQFEMGARFLRVRFALRHWKVKHTKCVSKEPQ